MVSKTQKQKLEEKIFLQKKTAWESYDSSAKEVVFGFGEKYKRFLKSSKTERQCAKTLCSGLSEAGFKPLSSAKLKTGDKIYKNYRGKAVLAAVIGKKKNQLNIIGSHMDSPRLDLKQQPLFEDVGDALFKSHYYGGIKKYQWVNTPLAMHGVIHTKKGDKIEFSLGEKEKDPKFIIPDLLPHLAKKQMEKTGDKIIEGEQLNIFVGSIPVKSKTVKEKTKFAILKYLHEKHGIIEEDFLCAEIEFVPAADPVDIGFDKSMIAAYGQDDKACAFTSYRALRKINNPTRTAVAFFADKEEIGSVGDTGAASHLLEDFISEIMALCGVNELPARIFENSRAISADVNCAFNSNFKEVQDPMNVNQIGYGVSLTKYGGGGGKYSTNDASAEYMQEIRELLNKNKVIWQTGEFGKVDEGGGGTIAMFMSKYGINTVDAGPPILAMHSPQELSSKADIYETYKLYKAFFMS